ncbi:hypothetical protein ADUPG1_009116 [Aduncisulcus paluster]|uniref:Uncharacterized protein n=1 Tax=Aduncisulcus paluster TaxID=2918883 RepID=A0ABQ5KUJ1_9EUKA|nr:hypothetical protein ADUPG1_009116 [Aduncisulcus paluster]
MSSEQEMQPAVMEVDESSIIEEVGKPDPREETDAAVVIVPIGQSEKTDHTFKSEEDQDVPDKQKKYKLSKKAKKRMQEIKNCPAIITESYIKFDEDDAPIFTLFSCKSNAELHA